MTQKSGWFHYEGQGQSDTTEKKERDLETVFVLQNIYFNRFKSKNPSQRNKFPYFHFDCHAGSGINEDVGVIGSPLLFREIAIQQGAKFIMVAIEKNEERGLLLANRLKLFPNCFVQIGDNKELVESIPSIIRRFGDNPSFAFGSVLIDPNSPKDLNEPSIPWDGLRELGRVCPKVDVVFNFPGTAMKRIRCTFGTENRYFVDLDKLPNRLRKKHLLIREPIGRTHFTLVVGRNYDYGDWKNRGFYDWNSREGKRLRRKARFTEKERKEMDEDG